MLDLICGNFVGTPAKIGNVVKHAMQLRHDIAKCICAEEWSKGGNHKRSDWRIARDSKMINLEDPSTVEIKGCVHQICVDHFWCNNVCWADNLRHSFFTKCTWDFWFTFCWVGWSMSCNWKNVLNPFRTLRRSSLPKALDQSTPRVDGSSPYSWSLQFQKSCGCS
jgi:hypothetical protein